MALRRADPGQPQPGSHRRRHGLWQLKAQAGLRLRPLRHRRPLPGGLQRGPRRRDRHHRRRSAGAGGGMVRRPRGGRGASPVRQRAGLPVPGLAAGVQTDGNHAQADPALPTSGCGKIERFHRTLADGWAYTRCYTSETQCRQALAGWIHFYNRHRPHAACNSQPPYPNYVLRQDISSKEDWYPTSKTNANLR